MALLLRHKLLIAGATIVAAASAGGAYAATQSGGRNQQQAFLNDVAKRLHVSPAQLRSAVKAALVDRLQAAVKRGQLTQAQANRIEKRLARSGRLPLFFAPGPHPFLRPRFAVPGPLHTAASYLGLTDMQLLRDLRSGKSVAEVATARGKLVSGLEQAITSAEKTRLDQLVSAGVITKAREQRLLSRLSRAIDRLVNRAGLGRLIAPRALPPGPPMIPPPGGVVGPPAASPVPVPAA